MFFIIRLKVCKNKIFPFSLKNAVLPKPQGWSNLHPTQHPLPPVVIGLTFQKVPRIKYAELEKNMEMNTKKPNYI